MSSIDFVIDHFSSSYTMKVRGEVDDPITGLADASCVAVFYIPQNTIQDIFKFQSDSYDFTDENSTDIRYFIYMNRWPAGLVISPVNAMVDLASSPMLNVGIPNKMLVKHDYIRYLAKELFNTPNGVDLFNNEVELLGALNTIGMNAWQNDISGSLWRYATTSSYPVGNINSGFIIDESSGLKCTTGDLEIDVNFGFKIFNQILMTHPHRVNFSNLDQYGQGPIPILAGDTISFRFQVNPHAGQHLLTGVPSFGGRSYVIKLIIDNGTGVNISPVD